MTKSTFDQLGLFAELGSINADQLLTVQGTKDLAAKGALELVDDGKVYRITDVGMRLFLSEAKKRKARKEAKCRREEQQEEVSTGRALTLTEGSLHTNYIVLGPILVGNMTGKGQAVIVPRGWPTPLESCPPGLFHYQGAFGFKGEHIDNRKEQLYCAVGACNSREIHLTSDSLVQPCIIEWERL
jgi:hypothetical protein